MTSKVPSVIWSDGRSRRLTHSTAQTSSPGRSVPPVAHDALEDFEYAQWPNFKPSLFQRLAAHRVFQPLPGFQRASRQRPPPFERRLAALRHENSPSPYENGAHPHQRVFGVAAIVGLVVWGRLATCGRVALDLVGIRT